MLGKPATFSFRPRQTPRGEGPVARAGRSPRLSKLLCMMMMMMMMIW